MTNIRLIDKEETIGVTHPIKDEYYSLQIASLLHDIGKFFQRTGKNHNDIYSTLTEDDFGDNGAHSKWSASFIKEIGLNHNIEEWALYHHKYTSLSERDKLMCRIVSTADIYSCKEREDIEYKTQDIRKEPLISVFSNLNISSINKRQEYYNHLTKLELKELLFPVASKKDTMKGWNLTPEYDILWKEFLKETKNISGHHMSFDTLYYLLKKYTSFIPSAAYVSYPDISLFDHLKTTAAISVCIYTYLAEKGEYKISNKKEYFTLISGNISGVQNFIYNISSPQFAQKHMAERLRGRSFYVSILNDNLARIIVERLELTDANILWCGGGYFLIIAPNTNKAEKILKEYEREINESLFKQYGSKLFLSLAYRSVSGEDLDNFARLKENILFDNLRHNKQKYFDNLDMVFKEEESAPPDICRICGNIVLDMDTCEECSIHEDLGDRITRAKYVVRFVLKNSTDNEFDFKEFNIGYLLLKKKEDLLEEIEKIYKSASKIQIFTLNSTDFLDLEIIKKLEEKNINASFGFSFLGNTVPSHDKYGPLSFEHMANISKGSKKLGIFKMDIDDLGKLFEIGLGDTISISRTSTMSSLLDVFMSGYINEFINEYYILSDVCPECRKKVDDIDIIFSDKYDIKVYREKENGGKIEKVCSKCLKNKIPILYIGYSGGDDMLIIGPWDIIVRFARDLRSKFKRYMCMNKDINISAGIYICGHKLPIGRAVHIADDLLHKSKIEGKDRISIFGETVKWEDFDRSKGYDELLQFADKLELLIYNKKISKSFVYSLLTLFRSTFGDIKELELEDRVNARLTRNRHIPKLKYSMARNVEKDIMEDLNEDLIVKRLASWIEIPVSIASLKWR